MNIVDAVHDYISACPLLKDGRLGVDWLGSEPVEYVIEVVPAETVIKKYADGGALKQLVFLFASREAYSADILDNLSNCGFYEQFADWVEMQDKAKIYPDMGQGRVVTGIRTTTCGYLFDADANTRRYQIQCVINYQED